MFKQLFFCQRRMTEVTEKQQTYEELFSHRFSSEDHEYQQYVTRPADPPPIVEDWRGRGGGNQRGRDNRSVVLVMLLCPAHTNSCTGETFNVIREEHDFTLLNLNHIINKAFYLKGNHPNDLFSIANGSIP